MMLLPKLDTNSLLDAYRSSYPFPHVVLDNAFSEHVLNAVLDEFPGPAEIDWVHFNNEREIKLGSRGPGATPGINNQARKGASFPEIPEVPGNTDWYPWPDRRSHAAGWRTASDRTGWPAGDTC